MKKLSNFEKEQNDYVGIYGNWYKLQLENFRQTVMIKLVVKWRITAARGIRLGLILVIREAA